MKLDNTCTDCNELVSRCRCRLLAAPLPTTAREIHDALVGLWPRASLESFSADDDDAGNIISNALLDRIEKALERHLYGHAPRRIPADQTDSDIVLFDLRAERAAWSEH